MDVDVSFEDMFSVRWPLLSIFEFVRFAKISTWLVHLSVRTKRDSVRNHWSWFSDRWSFNFNRCFLILKLFETTKSSNNLSSWNITQFYILVPQKIMYFYSIQTKKAFWTFYFKCSSLYYNLLIQWQHLSFQFLLLTIILLLFEYQTPCSQY